MSLPVPPLSSTAIIISEIALPGLPSASGVELVGARAYVVSDDAPWLYQLDAATLAPAGRVALFSTDEFGSGRLPKATKPDLECLTAVPGPGGAPGLLLGGSGSRPNRARGYFVPLPAAGDADGPAGPAQPLDLGPLYAGLRAHLPAGEVLNLEAATTATELLLLQRGVGAGAALVFGLPLAATLRHLLGGPPAGPAPAPGRVLPLKLPQLAGHRAGFSGATFVGGQLLVTASVEDTADAVLDGAVLGSFVGVLDLAAPAATFARLAWADGRAYRGKVEGLAVRRVLGPGHWELLLVTDDDQGGSTALVAELRLPGTM